MLGPLGDQGEIGGDMENEEDEEDEEDGEDEEEEEQTPPAPPAPPVDEMPNEELRAGDVIQYTNDVFGPSSGLSRPHAIIVQIEKNQERGQVQASEHPLQLSVVGELE